MSRLCAVAAKFSAFGPRWEPLEKRVLLSSSWLDPGDDGVDYGLSNAEAGNLLNGLAGFGDWLSDAAGVGDLAVPLAGLADVSGEGLTLGSVLDLEQVLADTLTTPITDYFNALDPASPTTAELDAYLTGLPSFSAVRVGAFTAPDDEVRIDVAFNVPLTGTAVSLDLGDDADALGLSAQGAALTTTLGGTVTVGMSFGLTLDPTLADAEAFFLRDVCLEGAVALNATGETIDGGVGFLEVTFDGAAIDLNAGVRLEINDPVSDSLGNVTSSELAGALAEDTAATTVTADSVSGTLPVSASLGGWSTAGSAEVAVGGAALDATGPTLTPNAGFDEVAPFGEWSANDIHAGWIAVANLLNAVSAAPDVDVDVPFVGGVSVGGLTSAGDALRAVVIDPLESAGLPAYSSAQGLAAALTAAAGVSVTPSYDPTTGQLGYALDVDHAEADVAAPLVLNVEAERLSRFESADTATLSRTATIDGTVLFDLDSTATSKTERVLIDDLTIGGSVGAIANNADGTARLGLIDLSFGDADLTGDLTYTAQVDTGVAGETLKAVSTKIADGLGFVIDGVVRTTGFVLNKGDLTVDKGIVTLDAGAEIVTSVTETAAGNTVDVVVNNAAILDKAADINDDLANRILEKLSEVVERVNPADQVRTLYPLDPSSSLDAVDPAQLIDEGVDAALSFLDAAAGLDAPSLQDIAEFYQDGLRSVFDSTETTVDLVLDKVVDNIRWQFTLVDRVADAATDVVFDLVQVANNDGVPSELAGLDSFAASGATFGVDAGYEFDIDLVIDLDDATQTVYVADTSRFDADFYANTGGPSLADLSGVLGPLGVTLSGGEVIVAQSLTSPTSSAPATYSLTLPSVSGTPGYDPDTLNAGDFDADATGQTRVAFDDVTETGTGASFAPGGSAPRFRVDLTDLGAPGPGTVTFFALPDFAAAVSGLDLTSDLSALRDGLDQLLGGFETGLGSFVLNGAFPLIGGGLADVANVLTGLRTDAVAGVDGAASATEADIRAALEAALGISLSAPTFTDEVIYDLSKTESLVDVTQSFDTDFGLPGLNLDVSGLLTVAVDYDLNLGIGVSTSDGAFLVLDESNPELEVTVEVTLDGAVLAGRLGFLSVELCERLGETSGFTGTFSIELDEPSGDDRLTLAELQSNALSGLVSADLSGAAELNLEVKAGTTADWLPGLRTDLDIDWAFGGGDLTGSAPTVVFGNLEVELGQFAERVISPFFGRMTTFLEPIQPGIDVFTAEIPIISDFFDDPVSLASILSGLGSLSGQPGFEFLAAVGNVVTTLDQINSLLGSLGSGAIRFGDLDFGSTDLRLALTDNFDVGALADVDSTSPIDQAAGLSSSFTSTLFDSDNAGLTVPFLENPTLAFELLLGLRDDIELIGWDLPTLSTGIGFEVEFPVFPAVTVGFFGNLTASADLALGLDTRGFVAYAESGDLADLADGFYLSDTGQSVGGSDVPEFLLRGEVGVQGGLDVAVAEAKIAGGVAASLFADLNDHDGDGKLRAGELAGDCVFSIGGEISIFLEAFAKVGFKRFDFPLAEFVITEFEVTPDCPPEVSSSGPELFHIEGGNELVLNMGPDADLRNVSEDVINEQFFVSSSGSDVVVQAFGIEQTYSGGAGLLLIRADGGDGDDLIDLSGFELSTPTQLSGGSGDDTIVGSPGGGNVIDGGGGDDELIGGSGSGLPGLFDDTIDGGTGNDEIDGGGGDDALSGGDGDDTIRGGAGNDTIDGDAGEDVLFGGTGNDTLRGGADDDVLQGEAGFNTLRGEGGDDRLFGTDNADPELDGGDGDDVIYGYGGDDSVLRGGNGDDYIDGGDGDDIIEGGLDSDTIYGGSGDDRVFGNESGFFVLPFDAGDQIYGESGNDTIDGQEGADTIDGGDGDDTITGGDGADVIRGESGNDTIDGNRGTDTLDGGSGNDVITGGEDADQILGGPGSDRLIGNSGSDDIRGGPGEDRIEGRRGDDTIDGGIDNDTIRGNDGNDTIHGRAGNDLIVGGRGADTIYGDGGDDVVYAGLGPDTVFGGTGDDRIRGEEGNDVLLGEPGADELLGGDGNDELRGGADDDRMLGDDGVDDLYGNGGADLLHAGSGVGNRLFGGDGDDEIVGSDEGGLDPVFGDGVLFGDYIEGGAGADVIYGLAASDEIHGGPGIDWIDAGLGNDFVNAGSDDDTVYGGDGDDVLEGDAGADTLIGDAHHDILYGHTADGVADDGAVDVLWGDFGTGAGEPGGGQDSLAGGLGHDFHYGEGDADQIILAADASASEHRDYGGGSMVAEAYGSFTPSAYPLPVVYTADVRAPLVLPGGPTGGTGWRELRGSATGTALTPAGGLDHTLLAFGGETYVAWSDYRHGNYEIYVAKYDPLADAWVEVNAGSASGGGVSNSPESSRRPALQIYDSGGGVYRLLVAWTEVASDGFKSLRVAEENLGWSAQTVPGPPTGVIDHVGFVDRGGGTFYLTYLDHAAGFTHLYAQDYNPAAAVGGFGPRWNVTTDVHGPGATLDVASYAADYFAPAMAFAVAWEIGDPGNESFEVWEKINIWDLVGTETGSAQRDHGDPDVAYRAISHPDTDREIWAAYTQDTTSETQVKAIVSNLQLEDIDGVPTEVRVTRHADTQRFGEPIDTTASSLSQTIGYASRPAIASAPDGVSVFWLDDSVHDNGDGLNKLYVAQQAGDVLAEVAPGEATGAGIAPADASADHLVADGNDTSYRVLWTETRGKPLTAGLLESTTGSTTTLTGDFNGSGQVEQGDLDLVLLNWGLDTNVSGVPAGWVHDNAGIGQVEQTELDKVLLNWGNTAAPPAAPLWSIAATAATTANIGVVDGAGGETHAAEPVEHATETPNARIAELARPTKRADRADHDRGRRSARYHRGSRAWSPPSRTLDDVATDRNYVWSDLFEVRA